MRWRVVSSVVATIVLAAAFASSAGAAPPPGYVVVHSASITASIDSQSHGVVACPGGTVPLGGGANVHSTSFQADMANSYPVGTEGWAADINNGTGTAFTFTVWVVCGTQPTGYTLVESPLQIDLPPNGTTLLSQACPLGTKVLGGGGSTDTASTALAIASTYPSKKLIGTHTQYSWNVVFDNATSTDAFGTTWAICGSPAGYRLVQRAAVALGGRNVTQTTVHPTCPSPKVPLSGGVQATEDTNITLNRTFPSSTAWRSVENDNAPLLSATLTPYVVCAGT
ncbi:MAG TPA: hypothetical protein VFL67_10260 [Mycobacterium sp.]|nr:hypothetical protein [Mycobacterium sp.]